MDNIKIGVFICHCGGNISNIIDIDKVREEISKYKNVSVSADYPFMCSEQGQNLISEAINENKINRVVVAACSQRLHELTFKRRIVNSKLNPYLLSQANIREQASWVHKNDPNGATQKVIKLIRAASAKAELLMPISEIEVESLKSALVIGAGPAGIKASLELAKKGISVNLIEKKPFIGGNIRKTGRLYPTNETAEKTLQKLTDLIDNNNLIKVFTNSKINDIKGHIGNFRILIEEISTGIINEITSGAIIIASGFEHYKPCTGEYGFGETSNIITLPELSSFLEDQKGPEFIYNGRKINNIGFIHCVGSRQTQANIPSCKNGKINEYCSRICCTATLHSAKEIKLKFPKTDIFCFYKDIRTYGKDHEELYYESASRENILFFRFTDDAPPMVEKGNDGKILVKVIDELTMKDELSVEVDLLVLSTGMEASNIEEILQKLKLPKGADNFLLEVHPKLRPVESAIGGIFLAGCAQAPFDITETLNSASTASVKAYALLKEGNLKIEPFIAKVDKTLCTACGKCVEACKYIGAVLLEDNEPHGETSKVAVVNPALCKGCGVCVSICPQRALDINCFEIRQFEAMVDEIAAG